MATGWAGEGAVQDQIDATVKDGMNRAKSRLPQGPSLTHCATCRKFHSRGATKCGFRRSPLRVLSGSERSRQCPRQRIQPPWQQG